jgi:[ribosomal protein S5]-alanine N-acetyltransferase
VSTRIETERMILREFELEDLDAVLRFGRDPQVTQYTGDAEMIQTEEDARNVITDVWHVDYRTHGYGRLAVEMKDTQEVIGFCGLKFLPELERIDIGYRLLPAYWGQGLATEAAKASLEHGREVLGLSGILGIAMVENVASQNVLKKIGLKLVERTLFDGFDVFIFE